ncbi:MAG TPA: tetratricopeptide repeat protein [Bryobacteraceae bacterium]|nr:tetratricopeptide repeat protein [Bryobacteraceae bacterium]
MEFAAELKRQAQAERDQGRLEEARRLYEQAAERYRALNDPLALAHTVRHVADIHRQQGHPELAARCYDEALMIYRANAETPQLDLANAIRGLALLKNEATLWQEARDLYAEVGVDAGVNECSRRLAAL